VTKRKWPTDSQRWLQRERERRPSRKEVARRKDDEHHEQETQRFERELEARRKERTDAVNRALHDTGYEYSASLRAINDPEFFNEHRKGLDTTERFAEWKELVKVPVASLTENDKKAFTFEVKNQTDEGFHKATGKLVSLWNSPLSKLRLVRVRTSRGKK
jgi:hypothetical protein